MSRDAFSHDPLESLVRHIASVDRTERPSRPITSDTRDAENSAPQAPHDRYSARSTERESIRNDSPRAYYLRDRAYLLRDSEMYSLKEIGKFRVIAAPDLAKYVYGGNRKQMEKDFWRLARQSLVTPKTVEISQKKTLRLVTLTKTGHRLLKKANQLPDNQSIYYGLVKPREAKHDADLYRLYQKEIAGIERAGGRAVRVLLDYELKRILNRDLALLGPRKDDPSEKERIAEKHGLHVVDGKIPVPDLRVEYETPDLERRCVDLELATRDYRPRAMAAKAKAGFSLYARSEDASRLRRVLDEREITAQILTL